MEQLQFKSDSIKQELESDLNKQFLQAKSLEKSGLYNEALLIFKNINQTKPGNINYYIPLKNYLKQAESLDTLLVYTKSFSNARNNDLQGKIELLHTYILMGLDNKWHPIAEELINSSSLKDNSKKNILKHLVNLGKLDFTYALLKTLRKEKGKEDFYSLELGTYLGMRMSFEQSTNEYLLYLKYHPKQLHIISDRIMAFPNDPEINYKIKSMLINSPETNAKYILADLQFKLREFDQAYETLITNNASDLILFDLGKDLAEINEFIRSEKIFTYIMQTSNNKQLLTQTIFEIANIFESQLVYSQKQLPISGFHPNNLFYSSPFVPLKEKSGTTLEQAIEIYDSLRVSRKNAQAAYKLAELQFRVLGDLDGALYLYKESYKHGNSKNLRIDSGLGIVNIYISKGNLNEAETECNKLITSHPEELSYQIKFAQILFYKGEYDKTNTKLQEIIKELSMDHKLANDIMDVMATLIAFKHNQDEFPKFAEAQLNIQQNKRIKAQKQLEELFNSNEIYIADMCRYQYSWLSYLQGDINYTKKLLNEFINDTIFKELAHIFSAELADYIERDIVLAIDYYLQFLELYPQSIYYDDIRLRLRKLAS